MIEQTSKPKLVLNRCPKCKGSSFYIDTEVVLTTCREFRNGLLIDGAYESALPRDLASFGSCIDCGHKWKLRDPYLNYQEDSNA